MNEVEKRVKSELVKKKFNFFDIAGFKTKPELALIAGMAIGYSMACDDIKDEIKEEKE